MLGGSLKRSLKAMTSSPRLRLPDIVSQSSLVMATWRRVAPQGCCSPSSTLTQPQRPPSQGFACTRRHDSSMHMVPRQQHPPSTGLWTGAMARLDVVLAQAWHVRDDGELLVALQDVHGRQALRRGRQRGQADARQRLRAASPAACADAAKARRQRCRATQPCRAASTARACTQARGAGAWYMHAIVSVRDLAPCMHLCTQTPCMTAVLANCSQPAHNLDEVFQGGVGLLEQRRKAPAACSRSTCMLTSCLLIFMTPYADASAAPRGAPSLLRGALLPSVCTCAHCARRVWMCVRRRGTQKSKALLTHLVLAVTVLGPEQRYAQHGDGGQQASKQHPHPRHRVASPQAHVGQESSLL